MRRGIQKPHPKNAVQVHPSSLLESAGSRSQCDIQQMLGCEKGWKPSFKPWSMMRSPFCFGWGRFRFISNQNQNTVWIKRCLFTTDRGCPYFLNVGEITRSPLHRTQTVVLNNIIHQLTIIQYSTTSKRSRPPVGIGISSIVPDFQTLCYSTVHYVKLSSTHRSCWSTFRDKSHSKKAKSVSSQQCRLQYIIISMASIQQ